MSGPGKMQVAMLRGEVSKSDRVSVLELSNDADMLEVVWSGNSTGGRRGISWIRSWI